jgi:predicted DNA-binding transcriptional regulator AlpA
MPSVDIAGAIKRDEKGRVIASDGWPVSGCATINETIAVSSLSRSKLYNMIDAGELETKRFGKSRRVTWASIRKTFLSSEVGL